MSNRETRKHKAHQKENQSRRSFDELIEPWVTTDFQGNSDYGLDKVVQVFTNVPQSENFKARSSYFFLQIKSTNKNFNKNSSLSTSIECHKISEWYNSNVPVLLAINHLDSNKFFTKWVDDNFIFELDKINSSWRSCKKVTVRFEPNELLTNENKKSLFDYILSKTPRKNKNIEPGTFFDLQGATTNLLLRYKTLASEYNFRSINQSIEVLSKNIDLALYRIAVTGQSRAGKSSLINSVIAGSNKEVTPTGLFQTTGVPIHIIPGKADEIKVRFENGSEETHKFSFSIIEQYASHQHNKNNHKAVSQLTIVLCNEHLQKGISFFDIPGLDDPNEKILDYTWNTLRTANAIIYVIDASPLKNGGYIFSKDHKANLKELHTFGDKVILVFNKVDDLPSDKLTLLKERIEEDLTDFNLRDKVNQKIFYVSAQIDNVGKDFNSIVELREELWDFLLRENKFGLNRIIGINQDILKSTTDFKNILNSRILDVKKKEQLEKNIVQIKKKIPELVSKFNEERNSVYLQISRSIITQRSSLLAALRGWLESSNPNDFPNNHQIKHFLLSRVGHTFQVCDTEYHNYFEKLKGILDDWMELNLKQVREILSDRSAGREVDISEVSDFVTPSVDLSAIWGSGFASALIGLFSGNPFVAIGMGLYGILMSFLATESGRKREKIDKIMKEAERRCGKAYEKVEWAYKDLIREDAQKLGEYAENKLNAFFYDLQQQIGILEPAHGWEIEKYELAHNELEDMKNSIVDLNKEIERYL